MKNFKRKLLSIDTYEFKSALEDYRMRYKCKPSAVVMSHETFDYLALDLDAMFFLADGTPTVRGITVETVGSIGFGEFYLK